MAETTDGYVASHYGRPGLVTAIREGLRAAYGERERFDPAELTALDQLHTWGAGATTRLAELAGVGWGDRVLDVGGGLGGAARQLATTFGCHVSLVDLTAELCEAAELLNRLTGLQEHVSVRQGDVLRMDFESGAFDVVWLQHVTMHVADKPRLFAVLRRALAAGGRLALWEIAAGPAGPPLTPVPWADRLEHSLLVSSEELRRMLAAEGFRELAWEDLTRVVARQMTQRGQRPGGRPALSADLVIPRLVVRQANLLRNLVEDRVALIMVVLAAD